MNILALADYYKHCHHELYPLNAKFGHSYMEARAGAEYPSTIFFGLSYLLKKYLSEPFTEHDIGVIQTIINGGVDNPCFNLDGFKYLLKEHKGYFPVHIRAVPEGMCIPNQNVLLTIENTDPNALWTFNFLETLLLNLWYPCTVATRSFFMQETINKYAHTTGCIPTQLVDFGQRSVSCPEQAALGGMAHLMVSPATATLAAIPELFKYYGMGVNEYKFRNSTEHSVMTAEGRNGEERVLKRILNEFPNGDISIVGDSYDIMGFIDLLAKFKDQIEARNGRVIVRPDSKRYKDDTPSTQILDVVRALALHFGEHVNKAGFKELNPKVGVIYGDGLDKQDIQNVLHVLYINGFAANVCAFGCGGYLLQELTRSTQNFAFKCSAMNNGKQWVRTGKETFGKKSKVGRLALIKDEEGYTTLNTMNTGPIPMDILQTAYINGKIVTNPSVTEIRRNIILS